MPTQRTKQQPLALWLRLLLLVLLFQVPSAGSIRSVVDPSDREAVVVGATDDTDGETTTSSRSSSDGSTSEQQQQQQQGRTENDSDHDHGPDIDDDMDHADDDGVTHDASRGQQQQHREQ